MAEAEAPTGIKLPFDLQLKLACKLAKMEDILLDIVKMFDDFCFSLTTPQVFISATMPNSTF